MVAPLINTASLYHWLPVADDEVNNTDPPAQNVVGPPGVIVGVAGIAFTVTTVAADGSDGHPFAATTTVYDPLVVAV